MVEIKTAEAVDLEKIAEYMAKMNSLDENRCAYIDNNKSEILDYLKEIHKNSSDAVIFIEEDEGVILGAAAGDICDDNSTIEVVGPFINRDMIECTKYLKQMVIMMKELKRGYRIKFFIDDKNEFIKQFIISNNGMITGNHCNMTLKLSEEINKYEVNNVQCVDYTKSLADENIKHQIEKLHDSIFSDAYYSSDTIIKKINDSNILSCCLVDGEVVSYAFYNLDDEGYLDFIGTDRSKRGKGYGISLLSHVLGNIKSRKCSIVRLCVNSDNEEAISMYKKAGFKITSEEQVYSM